MKSLRWRSLLIAVFSFAFLINATAAFSQDIYVGNVSGAEGDAVTVPIMVNNAPNGAMSFGLELDYDDSCLTYQSVSKTGTIVESFAFVDASEAGGIVRFGGFDVNGFDAGESGILININFVVNNPGCSSTLLLQNLVDGFNGWTSGDGNFTCTSCVEGDCTPDDTQSCDTALFGVCAAGTETCDSTGTWGDCQQDTQATTEDCDDNLDNDCDGYTDSADEDDCYECTPDDTQPCDTGLSGVCAAGTETCNSTGTWGGCQQDTQPGTENCGDNLDNDCDGDTDSADADCYECTPDDTQPCDTGLSGVCAVGTETCDSTGNWGDCGQDVQAGTEDCGDNLDNDCDGDTDSADADCYECTPDDTQSCDTGLSGVCAAGTETCDSTGTWGDCGQDVQAGTEDCDDNLDNDCDGDTDSADEDCYECAPDDTQACDTGLSGVCAAGTETCDSTGNWGDCGQDVQAATENCGDNLDNDCDGDTDSADEDCYECTPDETQSCDTGLSGVCAAGTETCDSTGTWGDCGQDVQAGTEDCDDNLDNDCDGDTDNADDDCTSTTANISVPDVSGRAGDTITVPVLISNAPNKVMSFGAQITFDTNVLALKGKSTTGTLIEAFAFASANESVAGVVTFGGFDTTGFAAGKSGTLMNLTFEVKSHCDSSSLTLQNPVDDFSGWSKDDGSFSCGSVCTHEETQPCDTGLSGVCAVGTETCDSTGTWGDCVRNNQPSTEICDDLDNDCDGHTDEDLANCTDCVIKPVIAIISPNGEITIPIRIDNAPDVIDSLGFDVTFDDSMLTFTGSTRGNLTTGFDFFDVNILSPGIVRVGGFETGSDKIPAGASGIVVNLNFTVGACQAGQCYDIAITGLVDDISGWSTCTADVCCRVCTPSDEVCDGVDNDCDGATDEGLTQRCGETDVGECEYGTKVCTNGGWGDECVGVVNPQDESCDGLDNDCDGATDEGLTQMCDTGLYGVCAMGTQTCDGSGQGLWSDCVQDNQPDDEACDDEDNDCDGLIDEDLTDCVGSIYIPHNLMGVEGETLIVPVMIDNAPNDVSSYGVDVVFDTSKLSYTECDTADTLVENFTIKDCSLVGANQDKIRLGGFDSGDGFSAGTGGTLTYIVFEVLACDVGESSLFELQDPIDHFFGWIPKNGSYVCSECLPDGDINEDGRVTPLDARMAYRFYMELDDLNECEQRHAEVNGDGRITPMDARCIYRYYMELSSCLDN